MTRTRHTGLVKGRVTRYSSALNYGRGPWLNHCITSIEEMENQRAIARTKYDSLRLRADNVTITCGSDTALVAFFKS